MEQIIQAKTIAGPLRRELQQRPFSGRVLGVFNRACNLVDDHRRIIAVVLPAVGKGPFAVSLDDVPALFDTLSAGQPAWANANAVKVGPWYILLDEAEVWEAEIDFLIPNSSLQPILAAVQPYADWPTLTEDTLVARQMAKQACTGALNLMAALRPPLDGEHLSAAVQQLAGLGQGLTPAGDDYLLGVIAALWLLHQTNLPPVIASAAIPKTGILSGAFLQAAARREFMEPWHALILAAKIGGDAQITAAVQWIADFGASSGTDALAGFAQTLINFSTGQRTGQY
jgi:hypothetical protein